MENLWSDEAARAAVQKYAAQGVNEDLALRTYTTRLLGGEPRLVQHGGGNTSVKTTVTDSLGRSVDVLCVKGSGWDMGTIEPPGLPAVKLLPLLELAALDALSDEDMVNLQRTNLIDASSPTPSVETLLHAFIPHKYVDHTHANATLSLCDRPDGMELCKKVLGPQVPVIPFVPPGFALAKKAKETFDAHPGCIGLMLHKHGIFSFGATARQAYHRMIELVSLAEKELAKGADRKLVQVKLPVQVASAADIAPILRGLLASPVDLNEGRWTRVVVDHRATPAVLEYVGGTELARYSQQGPVTPDHVIRTKPLPLILPTPEADKLDVFAKAARDAIDGFRTNYRGYFERHNAKANPKKKPLDDTPRVALIPGVGLFGIGPTAKDAAVTADIAETCASVVLDAEKTGRFETISEADQFDMEYWSLEQAKLGKAQPKPLQGQVAVVTGGAGTIGKATAAALRREAAEIVLFDIDAEAVKTAAKSVGGLGVACDVTNRASVDAAFRAVTAKFGGVDILLANAGAAWQGRIGEVDDAILRQSFELNFFGAQNVAQAAVKIMLTQATGGALLFNVSKQAVNPGPNFGPYGLPKAAAMALMRQYAIDYGADGITSNAVNADRIRSGLLTDDMVKARSTVRGVSERDYMSGNLLGREVRAEDVAEAFVALALARKTTGAVLTVDGGNIAAAMR